MSSAPTATVTSSTVPLIITASAATLQPNGNDFSVSKSSSVSLLLSAVAPANTTQNHQTEVAGKMPIRTVPFNRVMTSIEYRNMRFVVFDCPTDSTLPLYCEELKSRGVTDVVRVCEPTYERSYVEDNGIKLLDWPFPDGSIPPSNIIQGFLQLCDDRFAGGIAGAASAGESDGSGPAVGVHCVAGLGRAPVLVAIALIESGMAPLDAVEFIRRQRRGAFNTVQLAYLVDSYKRSWKKSVKLGSLLTKRSVSPKPAPSALTSDVASTKSSTLMSKMFGGLKKATSSG